MGSFSQFKTNLSVLSFALILGLFVAVLLPEASALDWGYDGSSAPKEAAASSKPGDLSSSKIINKGINKSPNMNNAGSNADPKLGSARSAFPQPGIVDIDQAITTQHKKADASRRKNIERQKKQAEEWLEFYSFVSTEPLSDEQRNRFRNKLLQAAQQPTNDFESIESFWPAVKPELKAKPEQQENYRALFKALLRLQLREPRVDKTESELLGEIIGPERIAVPQNPPLTEDAVEAYADMSCFIYEKTHPGKTVDALDNRTVFVGTIERRYADAASPLEKLAMSNFALKWAKFKVLYADANQGDKEKLFQRISGASAESIRKDISNHTLDIVMSHGPWLYALTKGSSDLPAQEIGLQKSSSKPTARGIPQRGFKRLNADTGE